MTMLNKVEQRKIPKTLLEQMSLVSIQWEEEGGGGGGKGGGRGGRGEGERKGEEKERRTIPLGIWNPGICIFNTAYSSRRQ